MIDTHCHLTFDDFDGRVAAVLGMAAKAGVDRMISIGTTLADSVKASELATHFYDRVSFTIGYHSHYAEQFNPATFNALVVNDLSLHERCVGFGEIGLDYHYPDPAPEVQQRCFATWLHMIDRIGGDKPVVIHCRKAVDDTLAIIRESGLPGDRFIFHCFTEPPEAVDKVLAIGAMVSFSGIVTYKNAQDVQASARRVPFDRLLIETDSPYLSPEPHRKVRPNTPAHLPATARFLAELRGVDVAQLVSTCDANAERVFALS